MGLRPAGLSRSSEMSMSPKKASARVRGIGVAVITHVDGVAFAGECQALLDAEAMLLVDAAAFPAVSRDASAQSYPARPITMIVPFAPGSPIDVLGRILAERMSKWLLQPIVVENVTGVEGTIGTGRVARARPDGSKIHAALMNGCAVSSPKCNSAA
jgi:hypothetical protein